MVAPYGAYPTRDGRTVVLGTTNDAEWRRLATEILGRPDLAEDPRLAANDQRCDARARLDGIIAGWTAERDLEEVLARADAARIGCATLNSIGDVLDHPQLSQRGRWVEVGSPAGAISALAAVPTSPRWRLPLDAVPGVGEHTALILDELDLEPALKASLLEVLGV
jgi:crotonobetainyl-CoA:carnitine CoA-transferase CaiB-like acyl-CoA transferase